MPSDDDKTRTFVPLTPGTEIGHYRIVDIIGSGGMDEVYKAKDTAAGPHGHCQGAAIAHGSINRRYHKRTNPFFFEVGILILRRP